MNGSSDQGKALFEVTPSAVAERAVSLLRLDGNETQLTRALAVLMRDNERLRRATIEALVRCGIQMRASDIPSRLGFSSETPAVRHRRLRSRHLGRVDWRFVDADATGTFELIVEVKIDATPGPEQFERYLDDDRVRSATRAAWSP